MLQTLEYTEYGTIKAYTEISQSCLFSKFFLLDEKLTMAEADKERNWGGCLLPDVGRADVLFVKCVDR